MTNPSALTRSGLAWSILGRGRGRYCIVMLMGGCLVVVSVKKIVMTTFKVELENYS